MTWHVAHARPALQVVLADDQLWMLALPVAALVMAATVIGEKPLRKYSDWHATNDVCEWQYCPTSHHVVVTDNVPCPACSIHV